MADYPRDSAPRYHRRVLAVGGFVALAAYVIGAPIYNGRIETDLERRVPDVLASAGVGGVSVGFDGQDGTLRCERPLDDPEAALDIAYGVWGVRDLELDRGCRVRTAPTIDPIEPGDESTGASDESSAGSTEESGGDDALSTTIAIGADFDTVADIVAGSPELSLLAALAQEADLDATLRSGDEMTLFAPSDAAFDALPADALADLRGDPGLLARVMSHHLADGRLTFADLESGPLLTRAGTEVDVVVGDDQIRVDGAVLAASDMAAGNGVVHVIDRVLVPPGVDLTEGEDQAATRAVFIDGEYTLSGVVATEVERTTLLAAAATGVGEASVDDQLDVDPDTGLDATTSERLAILVAAVPVHLVSGVTGFDGAEVFVRGRYATEAGRDAITALAESVQATVELEPRPEATPDDAVHLEESLNAFAAANPILFEPASDVLTESATAVIDSVAQRLAQFDGVRLTVEGHTDSDGTPSINLVLSRQRADAVVVALIERGLDPAMLSARGFGSDRPVLLGGVEDKAASRRVEFRVEVTS